MLTSRRTLVKNRILSMLSATEYRRMCPPLEQVSLQANEVLFTPGKTVRYIYFPDDAVVSLLVDVDKRLMVEVAMEGNEGAVGLSVYLGDASSCTLSIVREAGTAMRVDAHVLTRFANQGERLQHLLRKYVHALVTQIGQAGLCNRFHNIDARLARWLLMTQDRVGSSAVRATQQSIAGMLGVRRSSVTAAARGLHKQNMIDYRRGQIEILDQTGLCAASCSCYEIIKRQYDSFLD